MVRPAPWGRACVGVGLATLGVVVASTSLLAATATNNLTVTATVIASCSVSAGTLAFGDYDPTASSNLDQTGTFTVACTKGTTAYVGLDNGGNFATSRRMANGSEFLAYSLFQDSNRETAWGNATGSWVTVGPTTTNTPQPLTVYGRVTASQNVAIGDYSDTVLITVTF